jgi:hypothetical protein
LLLLSFLLLLPLPLLLPLLPLPPLVLLMVYAAWGVVEASSFCFPPSSFCHSCFLKSWRSKSFLRDLVVMIMVTFMVMVMTMTMMMVVSDD